MLPACLTAAGCKILLICSNSHQFFYGIVATEIGNVEYEIEYVEWQVNRR